MESSIYKFRRDRITAYLTSLYILLFLCALVLFVGFYDGGLFSAWLVSIVVAIVLLTLLSVPRDVEVSQGGVKINCLLDITEIDIANITSARAISTRELGVLVPMFGGFGLFGYYGHYFDFRHFRRVVIYTSEWRNLVEIVDIYEDHYYISCRDREAFLREIAAKMDER